MDDRIDIGLAEPGDVAALGAVAQAAYAPYVARMGRRPAPMDEDFAERVARAEVFAARAHGRVVGYLVCHPRGDHLHVANVAVAPEGQGKGLGKRLLGFAQAQAAARGLSAVELYTNIHMRENLAFYPALGFVETGRRREDGFDRVFYRKELG